MLTGIGALDAKIVGAQLIAYGPQIQAKTYALTRHYGQLATTRVKAKASGRPGPNAPTGEYRRSIQMKMEVGPLPGDVTSIIGTNAPQGRRLEWGFVEIDSIGRHYNQPPYPHFGPTIDEIGPEYLAATYGAVGLPMGPGPRQLRLF